MEVINNKFWSKRKIRKIFVEEVCRRAFVPKLLHYHKKGREIRMIIFQRFTPQYTPVQPLLLKNPKLHYQNSKYFIFCSKITLFGCLGININQIIDTTILIFSTPDE